MVPCHIYERADSRSILRVRLQPAQEAWYAGSLSLFTWALMIVRFGGPLPVRRESPVTGLQSDTHALTPTLT